VSYTPYRNKNLLKDFPMDESLTARVIIRKEQRHLWLSKKGKLYKDG
jgi:hypothetical protein